MNKKGTGALGIIIFIIVITIGWGVVGGIAAQDSGVTCDIGAGDFLCWKWHKNIVGQAEEFINDMFG